MLKIHCYFIFVWYNNFEEGGNFMKKILVVSLIALLSLTACGSKAEKYTGEGQGMNGKITATVTIEDGKITDVAFDHEGETEGISDPAFEQMPQRFIDAQSANVDVVSGATYTSEGMIDAVAEALEKAGL